MTIPNKKLFFTGAGLMLIFSVILIAMFLPLINGHNGLEYMDNLYNSISKGSAYYIPKVKKEAETFSGAAINVTLAFPNDFQAGQAAGLFENGNASVTISGKQLKVNGDLGKILENALTDADIMYHNKGDEISRKYGYLGKRVLFNWWTALKLLDKALKKQKKFEAAKVVALIQKKAVESSYNYYGIEAQKITERMGVVIFSLIFYVIYTLWYGFAILYMFEGWGLILGH